MAVQVRSDLDNRYFILRNGRTMNNEIVLQDAERSGDILQYTIMAQVPATSKWVPLTNLAAVDGTEIPRGILLCEILEADVIAGDVLNVVILVGDVEVRRDLLIADDGTAIEDFLADVVVSKTATIESALQEVGIYAKAVQSVSGFEN